MGSTHIDNLVFPQANLLLNQDQFNPTAEIQEGNIVRAPLATTPVAAQIPLSALADSNLVTYDGGTEELVIGSVAKAPIYVNRRVSLLAVFGVTISTPTFEDYFFTWGLNGSPVTVTQQTRFIAISDLGNMSVPAEMVVTNGDRISLWVNTATKSINLIIRDFNLGLNGIVVDEG